VITGANLADFRKLLAGAKFQDGSLRTTVFDPATAAVVLQFASNEVLMARINLNRSLRLDRALAVKKADAEILFKALGQIGPGPAPHRILTPPGVLADERIIAVSNLAVFRRRSTDFGNRLVDGNLRLALLDESTGAVLIRRAPDPCVLFNLRRSVKFDRRLPVNPIDLQTLMRAADEVEKFGF
jgi:hypothetical protein